MAVAAFPYDEIGKPCAGGLRPLAPDLRTVAYRGLFSVADDGGLKQLRMLQQRFLLGRWSDIGHEQLLVGPAFCVDQEGKSHFLLDGLVLPGG